MIKLSIIEGKQVECNGGSREEMHNCCNERNQCGIGQGDCFDDDGCEGDLVCGQNNCEDKFQWDTADCCTEKKGET